jgi:hypothetical protein
VGRKRGKIVQTECVACRYSEPGSSIVGLVQFDVNVAQLDGCVLMDVLTELGLGDSRRQRIETIKVQFFGCIVCLMETVDGVSVVDGAFEEGTRVGSGEGEIEALSGGLGSVGWCSGGGGFFGVGQCGDIDGAR